MTANQTLLRQQRLSDPKEFKAVFQANKKRFLPYLAVFSKLNEKDYARIGIVVSKRNVRKAHQRNLVRRIIRESFRFNQMLLTNLDVVIVVYQAYGLLSRKEMRRVMDEYWKKISHQPNKSISNIDKSCIR